MSYSRHDLEKVMTSEFPKIIWQTHKWNYKDLPEIYKKTSLTWQVMNPDWEYRYVTNQDMRSYIESLDHELLKKFDESSDNIIHQSDIWREAIIYEYGGIWADLDSICLFPIEKVIEKNINKEMICLPPVTKFGIDEKNNYRNIETKLGIEKIIDKEECGYWIPNSAFLGKKHNKISKEIFKSITGEWIFKERSFMGLRSELYEKYYNIMSLELLCVLHDQRFNERNN
jgi:mannosyltransferase OCH1-like enzyme